MENVPRETSQENPSKEGFSGIKKLDLKDYFLTSLDELKKLDINLAVLSNKPHEFTVSYVNHFFKDYDFKEVHGQKEDVPKKPDPKAAIDIVKCLDSSCEKSYFIGDTKIDMQTAKSANMTAIGVLWGFRDEKELRDFGADFIVSNPLEILKIIK